MRPHFSTLEAARPQRLLLLVCGSVLCLLAGGPVSATDLEYYSGEVVIRLNPPASLSDLLQDYDLGLVDSLPPSYLLSLPGTGVEEEFVNLLAADPRVGAAECAFRQETPEGTRQMVVAAVGGTIEDYREQNVVERLRLAELHTRYTGTGIVLAVLDTGVEALHEAFAGQVLSTGWDFVGDDAFPSEERNSLDDDGDGLIDEGAGHGTLVAGIAHLVAPDAWILPVRVLNDEGGGKVFDLARGIRFAADNGAAVINLSVGLTRHTFVLQDEILRARDRGVILVAAAGNLGQENPAYYPAMAPQVLSIAALDSVDVKADFSNWHHSVDISAPGIGIRGPYLDGGYALGAGTSFSAPFVSGQCALIRQAVPGGEDLIQIYQLARAGIVNIYGITANEPYLDGLGTGRFDGLATLLALSGAAGADIGPAEPASRNGWSVWPVPSRAGESVSLRFALDPAAADHSDGCFRVFDAEGHCLRVLTPTGAHAGSDFQWDGRDQAGRILPAGVYWIAPSEGRLTARIVIAK